MRDLYAHMLEVMDAVFKDFEAALPKPTRVQQKNGWVYRFKERDVYHAIVMKLALIQSTLRAAMLLLQNGYVMQQAMLHRVIDEANEDILFLVYAATNSGLTPLHERYLLAFWAEEFGDIDPPTDSHKSREMVPRKKIRAFLAEVDGKESNPSRTVDVTKVISKIYSGFIHGAAPHIMESYFGNPPHFHTHGMVSTPRIEEYTDDLWNYMYRGFLSHIFVAKAFGAEKHVEALIQKKKQFEALAGKKY